MIKDLETKKQEEVWIIVVGGKPFKGDEHKSRNYSLKTGDNKRMGPLYFIDAKQAYAYFSEYVDENRVPVEDMAIEVVPVTVKETRKYEFQTRIVRN